MCSLKLCKTHCPLHTDSAHLGILLQKGSSCILLTKGPKQRGICGDVQASLADDKSRQLLPLLTWGPYTVRTKWQGEKCSLADGRAVFLSGIVPPWALCLPSKVPWRLQHWGWDMCSYFNSAQNGTEKTSFPRLNSLPRTTSLYFTFIPFDIGVDIRKCCYLLKRIFFLYYFLPIFFEFHF